ncbi:hypothetical protein AAHN93_14785 [Vandammella animalimorsus]|uniref:hypothetical protein n=1 Tax=Vandammella animalimorsus TaxID=2029117 RepID=UPI0031B9D382
MGVSVTVNNTARAASHAPAGELSDAARQAMDGATNMGVLNPGRLAEDLARRPAAERQQLLQELGPHLSPRDADSLTQELATRSTPAQGSEQSAGAACNHAPRSSPRLEQLEALKRETAGLDPDQLDAFVRFDETHALLDEAIQGIRVDTSGQYGWLEGGLRWAGDIGAQATRAVLGFGKDVALGLGQLVYEGGKLLVPGGSFHATLDAQILAEHIRLGNICLESLKQAMQGMGQAAVKPVTDAWERGDYAEAVMRSGLEVGTLIAGVGAAAKAAGTAGKAAGAASAVVNSADEVARMAAAGRAAASGADEAAKVAAGGTTGTASAVANSADEAARTAAAGTAVDGTSRAAVSGTVSNTDEVTKAGGITDDVGAAARSNATDGSNGGRVGSPHPLRQAYIDEVNALKAKADEMLKSGVDKETVAREMHASRRELGVKYKNLTPEDMLERIYQRNIERYGDKLGPSIEWLRNKGKSWGDIIESATRTGGKDLGL